MRKHMLRAVLFFLMTSALPVHASETGGNPDIRLRAKIEYIREDGSRAEAGDMAVLSSGRWEYSRGYYYWNGSIVPGQPVELIRAVRIPADWKNERAGEHFDIRITAEAGIADYTGGVWNGTFRPAGLGLEITEYETGPDGREREYRDNKTVVPGELVSKIVRITVQDARLLPAPNTGSTSVVLPVVPAGNIRTGDDRDPVGSLSLFFISGSSLAVYLMTLGRKRYRTPLAGNMKKGRR